MSTNRRQFVRIQFHTEARLYTPDQEFAVQVEDLSLKGALVQPEKPVVLAPATLVRLQIRLDELGPMISMSGKISHREGDTYGIACAEIDLDSITHLRRLVELNLGDESLLERDLHHLMGLQDAR